MNMRGRRPRWDRHGCVAATAGVLAPTNLVMFYLLGVVAVAMRSSRRTAFFASFLSVAAFDFFCVPPYLTFAVSTTKYLVTFVVMLLVALVISTLTVRTRMQAAHAIDREAQTHALYRSRGNWRARGGCSRPRKSRPPSPVRCSLESDHLPAGEQGRISFRAGPPMTCRCHPAKRAWRSGWFDHGRKAGRGTDTLPAARALYLPLKDPRMRSA